MFDTILKIERDIEGCILITVDGQEGWEISENFKIHLLRELQNQMNGEFSALASRALTKLLFC